jgi:hypothetical protein
MRVAWLVAVILVAGCSSAPPPPPPDPNSFEVDAKGAPAVVERTLTLDGLGEPIGFVSAVSRCGDVLFFADHNGQVRRLNVATGETLPSLARDTANMAMGVDCSNRSIYLFGPAGRRMQRGMLQVQAFDLERGTLRRSYPLKLMLLPDFNATVAEGTLVIGGTWMPMPTDGKYQHPAAAAFYSDKKLGLGLSLDSGAAAPLLAPYEPACRGHCGFATLSPVVGQGTLAWLATQASSKEVAIYDGAGVVQRRFDVTSPAFADDGSVLRAPGGEPDVRWSARNSLLKSADQFGDVIATVHYLVRLPVSYVFGQSVEFDYWMNLHGVDGRRLVSDIKLPGMPIGHDATHLYVTDYGPDGRQSAPDKLKILRISVKTGTDGFRR